MTRIVLTLGDPRGIGPEVVAEAARLHVDRAPDVDLLLVGPSGADPGVADYLSVDSFDRSEAGAGAVAAAASVAEAGDVVLRDFIGFIGDAVLIGHFVFIDVNFVNRAMKTLFGISLQSPAIDTSTLHDWLYENDSRFARHHSGMTFKNDLFSLARRYGIDVEKTHNAIYDAYITAQLFQRFASFLPGCGIKSLKELLKIARP